MLRAIVFAPEDYEEAEKFLKEGSKVFYQSYVDTTLFIPEHEPLETALCKSLPYTGTLPTSSFADKHGCEVVACEGENAFSIGVYSRSTTGSKRLAEHGLRAVTCTLWHEADFVPKAGFVVADENLNVVGVLTDSQQALFFVATYGYERSIYNLRLKQTTGVQKGLYIPVTKKRFIVGNNDMVISVALNERAIKVNTLFDVSTVANERLARMLVSSKYLEKRYF